MNAFVMSNELVDSQIIKVSSNSQHIRVIVLKYALKLSNYLS